MRERLNPAKSGMVALGTVGILAFVPTNPAKLLALLVLWTIAFWPVRKEDVAIFVAVGALFTVMNAGALRQGVFAFRDPDLIGMPVWEFFMWGFYVLLTLRTLDGAPPPRRWPLALTLAAAFAAPFATIPDPGILLLAASFVLALALFFFHDPQDLAYAGFMLGLGALVEYAGVWSGQWGYPAPPAGGVPLWFAAMWAGVGLFTRRLILPGWLRLARGPGLPSHLAEGA